MSGVGIRGEEEALIVLCKDTSKHKIAELAMGDQIGLPDSFDYSSESFIIYYCEIAPLA